MTLPWLWRSFDHGLLPCPSSVSFRWCREGGASDSSATSSSSCGDGAYAAGLTVYEYAFLLFGMKLHCRAIDEESCPAPDGLLVTGVTGTSDTTVDGEADDDGAFPTTQTTTSDIMPTDTSSDYPIRANDDCASCTTADTAGTTADDLGEAGDDSIAVTIEPTPTNATVDGEADDDDGPEGPWSDAVIAVVVGVSIAFIVGVGGWVFRRLGCQGGSDPGSGGPAINIGGNGNTVVTTTVSGDNNAVFS